MGFVLLVSGLAAVVILFGIAMLWQERAELPDTAIVYGVEDSIEFVWDGLDEDARSRLRRADVRRMLEWEVRWLQSATERGDAPAVVGSIEAAAYVQERCWEAGHAYEPQDVLAVLDLQAAYLASLGAVGEAVADEIREDGR